MQPTGREARSATKKAARRRPVGVLRATRGAGASSRIPFRQYGEWQQSTRTKLRSIAAKIRRAQSSLIPIGPPTPTLSPLPRGEGAPAPYPAAWRLAADQRCRFREHLVNGDTPRDQLELEGILGDQR